VNHLFQNVPEILKITGKIPKASKKRLEKISESEGVPKVRKRRETIIAYSCSFGKKGLGKFV
jgi:hypothetical protein